MQYKVTMTKTFREDGKYISFEETQTKITTNKDDRDFADTDAYPVSTSSTMWKRRRWSPIRL